MKVFIKIATEEDRVKRVWGKEANEGVEETEGPIRLQLRFERSLFETDAGSK